MTEWETAIASGEFYFTVNRDRKHQIFKMERRPDGLYWCCPLKGAPHYYPWDVRQIRRACKNWTLVTKQEKVDVDNLYQKIDAKQKLLGGLNKRSKDLEEQAEEVDALIVKEERQLAELKHELLAALKKELGS